MCDLVREREVGRVVVGLPLSLCGADSAQTTETRAFAARLAERIAVPVELYDERFTTLIASRDPGDARRLGGLARRRAPARRVAGDARRRRPPATRAGGRVAFMTNLTAR